MNLETPRLADIYEQEIGVIVKKKYYQRFRGLEELFVRHGINPTHYAKIVAILWMPWCVENNFNYLPINVFLGGKSVAWYISIRQQVTVDLLLNDPRKEQAEYEFALAYLEHKMNAGHLSEREFAQAYQCNPTIWQEQEADEERAKLIPGTIDRLSKFGRFATRKYCPTYDRLLEVRNAKL